MTYQALSLTMTLNDLQKLLFELLETLNRQCFENKHHAPSQKLITTSDDVMRNCKTLLFLLFISTSRTFKDILGHVSS